MTSCLPGSSRPGLDCSCSKFSCGTQFGEGCHEFCQSAYALAAAGDSPGADGVLLVGQPHPATIANPVHPGAAFADLDHRRLSQTTEVPHRVPGLGGGLPDPGAGATAMGV